MNNEKDFIVITSCVAAGVIIASGLSAVLHRWEVLPVTIFGCIMFPLILLQTKERFAHIVENLENIVFIVTLIIIVLGFIVIYKPV